MFSLICVCINDWVNEYEACDLRRYCAHYDVIVMHYLNHTNNATITLWLCVNVIMFSCFKLTYSYRSQVRVGCPINICKECHFLLHLWFTKRYWYHISVWPVSEPCIDASSVRQVLSPEYSGRIRSIWWLLILYFLRRRVISSHGIGYEELTGPRLHMMTSSNENIFRVTDMMFNGIAEHWKSLINLIKSVIWLYHPQILFCCDIELNQCGCVFFLA